MFWPVGQDSLECGPMLHPDGADLSGRNGVLLDQLDLTIIEAVILDAFGPDGLSAMLTQTRRDGSRTFWQLSGAGPDVLWLAANGPDDSVRWVELAASGIVEAAVAQHGELWRPEAVIGVESALADRAGGRLASIAILAGAGRELEVEDLTDEVALCGHHVLDSGNVALVG